jgi:dipeptidase E
MKLIITGGGDSEHFEEIDSFFISQLGENPRLLFIPLAGDPETFDDGLERIQETFSTIEFHKIEMCLDLEELEWDYLSQFDAVYIDGGNTFTLMEEIRNTHFYELLHRFLHHGGVVNGDSAGAIILGSHLETAHFGETPDENETEVISYQGLNLLGQWAIHCHYNSEEEDEVLEFVREFGFPVLALHEETAIAIDGRDVQVIGKASATLFTQKEVIVLPPGSQRKI